MEKKGGLVRNRMTFNFFGPEKATLWGVEKMALKLCRMYKNQSGQKM